MLPPYESQGFKRILLSLFGLFSAAKLSMGTFAVAPMPSCPHAQGPASFGTRAAFPIPSPICPKNLHTSLMQVPLTYRIHKGPGEPAFFIGYTISFQTHPFLAPAFKDPCIPDKIFSATGFGMAPNTQRYYLLLLGVQETKVWLSFWDVEMETFSYSLSSVPYISKSKVRINLLLIHGCVIKSKN